LGRVVIVTSPNSASLQRVARDIAKVFNEKADELGITQAEVSLSRVAKPSAYKDVELTIVVMVFDPVHVKGYAFIVWNQKQQHKPVIFYTTVEGKILNADIDAWMKRDLSAIANSQYTAEKLKEYGMRVDGIVYHGVDIAYFQQFADSRSVVRQILGLDQNDFVVGYIAGCYKRKGHDRFAEVIQHVHRHDPNIKFVVVTQQNCAEYYNKLDNVVLITRFGQMSEEEITQMYYAFDVYAQGSLAEGFGLPILEAMTAGLPIVHADYKPLSEITTPEISIRVPVRAKSYIREGGAILYELHLYDAKEFADAILKAKEAVLSDKETIKRKAIVRASEFDIHKVYNSFIEIFKTGKVQNVL